VDIESGLFEAMTLAAMAKPDSTLWTGPSSNALLLRIETLIQELSQLGHLVTQLRLAETQPYAWSSASLLN
jgi:hypothetical protein